MGNADVTKHQAIVVLLILSIGLIAGCRRQESSASRSNPTSKSSASSKPVDSHVETVDGIQIGHLIAQAATSNPDEYVKLRKEFLKLTDEREIEGNVLPTDATMKHRVIVDAWRVWRIDPETADRLWNYKPPRNPYRNPFPRMAADTRATFEAAGATGLVIAREIIICKRRTHRGVLLMLLAQEKSPLSVDVIVETALNRPTCNLAWSMPYLDKSIAERIFKRFDEMDEHCLQDNILMFTQTKYRPVARRMGTLLLTLRPRESTDLYGRKHSTYSIADTDLGYKIAMYFEAVSDFSFEKCYDPDICAKVIDDAKQWWIENESSFPRRRKNRQVFP